MPYPFHFGNVFGWRKVDLEDSKTSAQCRLIFFQLCKLLFDVSNAFKGLCTGHVTAKRTLGMELIKKCRHLPLELLT